MTSPSAAHGWDGSEFLIQALVERSDASGTTAASGTLPAGQAASAVFPCLNVSTCYLFTVEAAAAEGSIAVADLGFSITEMGQAKPVVLSGAADGDERFCVTAEGVFNFVPTALPTASSKPTVQPSQLPTVAPTFQPTHPPTAAPSQPPSPLPTAQPTPNPTPLPSPQPTAVPAPEPSKAPVPAPTSVPRPVPTLRPTSAPSDAPLPAPTAVPAPSPTAVPAPQPTPKPSEAPSPEPSAMPFPLPSIFPTPLPSPRPSLQPTVAPSHGPSPVPTPEPSSRPTLLPTPEPTTAPLPSPTKVPIPLPTRLPTPAPSMPPIPAPTSVPAPAPTGVPRPAPSLPPSLVPTASPSVIPASVPTAVPLPPPSGAPSVPPTPVPAGSPSAAPVPSPTQVPAPSPTARPTPLPSSGPSPSPSEAPTPHPSAHPTRLPTPPPTQLPTPVPTHTPTAQPYALVKADFTMALAGVASAADFDSYAAEAFKAAVVATSGALSDTSEISSVAASDGRRFLEAGEEDAPMPRRSRRRQKSMTGRALAVNGAVTVSFTVAINSRDAEAKGYAGISGQVSSSDDEWINTPATRQAAADLAGTITADLAAAAASGAWDATAAAVVAAMPLGKTGGGTMSLAGTAAGASLMAETVEFFLCSPDKYGEDAEMRQRCITTPSPTIVLPSQVPTPAPTRDPDFAAEPSSAALALALVAFANVAICASLISKQMKTSAAKAVMRSDLVLKQELSKFSHAHVVDLFGSTGGKTTRKDRGRMRDGAGGPEEFTKELTHRFFGGLDVSKRGRVTAADVAWWVGHCAQQTKHRGSQASDPRALAPHELDAFLRGGRSKPGARVAGAPPPPPAELTEHALGRLLKRFPTLAFDWDDAMGTGAAAAEAAGGGGGGAMAFGAGAGAQLAFTRREVAFEVFRRIDTDRNTTITEKEIRVWRRMLPLGRSEDQLVRDLLGRAQERALEKRNAAAAAARATTGARRAAEARGAGGEGAARRPSLAANQAKTAFEDAAAAAAAPAGKRAQRRSTAARGTDGGFGVAEARAAEEEVSIKATELWAAVRDNPLLGAELACQCALLDFILLNDGVEDGDSLFDDPDDDSDIQEVIKLDNAAKPGLQRGLSSKGVSFVNGPATTGGAAAAAAAGGPSDGGGVKAKSALKVTSAYGDSFGHRPAWGQWNDEPGEAAAAAFVCVAKLKLCRLALAQHEHDTKELTLAGVVFRGLDPKGHGFVSTHDVQAFLQRDAGLESLDMGDLGLVFGTRNQQGGEGGSTGNPMLGAGREEEAWGDGAGEYSDSDDGSDDGRRDPALGRLMDHRALKEVLSAPQHHAMGTWLHRFVTTKARIEQNHAHAAKQRAFVAEAAAAEAAAAAAASEEEAPLQQRRRSSAFGVFGGGSALAPPDGGAWWWV